jgi:small-conductance mechanosensitive channel/CRP-like cAMP-binding protein
MLAVLGRMGWPLAATGATLAAAMAWQRIASAMGLAQGGMGAETVRIAAQASTLLAAAAMLIRLLHVAVWEGAIQRRTGTRAPRLLTDLVDGLIVVSALVVIIAFVFEKPVTGLIATSGVAVAVIGFALKSMISDLFSGIAITLERPFHMGDWIEIAGGMVGQVVNLSWRATGLMLESGVYVVVPNSRLSEMVLRVYDRPEAAWRDEIEIILDRLVTAHQVERVLLPAAADIPEIAALGRKPDVRIAEFTDSGVKWRLRYWVPDYPSRSRLRYAVQRNILRNLHFSGISIPIPHLHAHLSRDDIPGPQGPGIEAFLRRVSLFTMLQDGEMAELAENADCRLIRADQAVVRTGEEGSSLFVVKEGLFEVMIPDRGGGEMMVARLKAGAFFGEMSLLTGAARGATVRACVDSMVIEIGKEALQPILARRPPILEAMSEALAERQLQNTAKAAEADCEAHDGVAAHKTLAVQLLGRMRSFFGLGRDRLAAEA